MPYTPVSTLKQYHAAGFCSEPLSEWVPSAVLGRCHFPQPSQSSVTSNFLFSLRQGPTGWQDVVSHKLFAAAVLGLWVHTCQRQQNPRWQPSLKTEANGELKEVTPQFLEPSLLRKLMNKLLCALHTSKDDPKDWSSPQGSCTLCYSPARMGDDMVWASSLYFLA